MVSGAELHKSEVEVIFAAIHDYDASRSLSKLLHLDQQRAYLTFSCQVEKTINAEDCHIPPTTAPIQRKELKFIAK